MLLLSVNLDSASSFELFDSEKQVQLDTQCTIATIHVDAVHDSPHWLTNYRLLSVALQGQLRHHRAYCEYFGVRWR